MTFNVCLFFVPMRALHERFHKIVFRHKFWRALKAVKLPKGRGNKHKPPGSGATNVGFLMKLNTFGLKRRTQSPAAVYAYPVDPCQP